MVTAADLKRPLLVLSVLALCIGARPPDRLGIGIATVDVAQGTRIDLFDGPDSQTPVATVEIEEDAARLTFILSLSSPDWLRPETLWLDYSLFAFRVVAATDDAYEVVVDGETGRTLWIRRQPAVEYKPWARYLVENVTGLSRLSPASNPLRAFPDAAAPVVPYSGSEAKGWDCLAVAEVRGEWARVRLSDLCAFGGAEPVDGWVRWRDGDDLLIGYGLTC